MGAQGPVIRSSSGNQASNLSKFLCIILVCISGRLWRRSGRKVGAYGRLCWLTLV